MYKYDKDTLKENLTIEEVFDLVSELGGEPIMGNGLFTARTICHGGDSHKLRRKKMKILIEIPKEFEAHFKEDAFEDSLHRLNADAHLLAGNYEQETLIMLIKAFKNAKILDKFN